VLLLRFADADARDDLMHRAALEAQLQGSAGAPGGQRSGMPAGIVRDEIDADRQRDRGGTASPEQRTHAHALLLYESDRWTAFSAKVGRDYSDGMAVVPEQLLGR